MKLYALEKNRRILPAQQNVEVVVSLNKNFSKPKGYIQIGIDAEDYYNIKDSQKRAEE